MKAHPASAVRKAVTDDDVGACFTVMQQLRSHLTLERYVEMVARMHTNEGYELAYIEEDGRVAAVAGYRFMELLYTNGKILYVDDLVTDENARSRGHGHALMTWLKDEALRNGC